MKSIGLASAFRAMTKFRVWGNECEKTETTLYHFSIVGYVLGITSIIPIIIMSFFGEFSLFNVMIMAAITLSVSCYMTRGFHLDGFADTFDGFGGGWTKERILEIMKDSRLGSFGATALMCELILKFVCLCAIIYHGKYEYIPFVMASSRCMTVIMCRISDYAKPDGLAKSLTDFCNMKMILVNLMWIALFFFIGEWQYLVMILISSLVAMLWSRHVAYRRIGGVTGDIMGFSNEMCESLSYLVLALYLGV